MSYEGKDLDVIVIGAGLTGLITARNLSRRGLKVLIFEARDRIGGRCWTRDFPGTDNLLVEMGGEWIDMNVHIGMIEECQQYGILLFVQSSITRHGTSIFLDAK